jgi:formylglycine-generating enzyme required for sulfatase activity
MYQKCLLFCLFLLIAAGGGHLLASGIQVSGTTVTTNDDKKTAQVKFTLEWDHSWRLDDGPKNWDAAWVYIKYRTLPGDNWNHAYITATGSVMPNNAEFKVGNSTAVIGGTNTNVGVGAFIYRKAAGNGSIAFTDVELRWNFTQNGLTGGEQVEVCVLATEMVYIPQGAFYLGDFTSTGRFGRNRSNTTTLRAEELVLVNAASPSYTNNFSNFWNHYTSTSSSYVTFRNNLYNNTFSSISAPAPDDAVNGNRTDNQSAINAAITSYASAINANFPRGFNAFYCMKYEITQGEYLQFLNKNLVAVKNAKTYFEAATTGRYAIRLKSGTGTAATPAEYELSNAGAAYLPCNFLGTKDVMAWLIWAGLRPMTELEFEKVCRGPEAVPGTASLRPQHAWGSVDIYNAAGFDRKGQANEGPGNQDGNCAVQTAGAGTTIASGTNSALDGPMRAGGFATPVSSRVKAGASYYGVMEMSGNLWERCITVGHNNGRAFQGGHGNGETGPGANPDLPVAGGWPPVNAQGLGYRGGSYLDPVDRARISDRYFINVNDHSRKAAFGGRGVRTAP